MPVGIPFDLHMFEVLGIGILLLVVIGLGSLLSARHRKRVLLDQKERDARSAVFGAILFVGGCSAIALGFRSEDPVSGLPQLVGGLFALAVGGLYLSSQLLMKLRGR